jgi:hypothetical protein
MNQPTKMYPADISTDTTITVDGYGGVINFEMEMLQQALEAWGYKVIVVNQHPEDLPPEEMHEWCEERLYRVNKTKQPIKLVANHRPWGG